MATAAGSGVRRLTQMAGAAWRCSRKVYAGAGAAALTVIFWLVLGFPLGVDSWLDASEPPVRADAIVCIGGGTTDVNLPDEAGWGRIYTAVQLFADGYAPTVVFTGRGSTSLTEAEVYADAATWLELPRRVILLDPLPSSTAEHPSSLLASSHGQLTRESRLLLVTSRAHSRRVLLTFRKQGFANVRVVSVYRATRPTGPPARHAQRSRFADFEPSGKSYDDPFNRLTWRSADLLTALREVSAIAWYWTRGLV